MTSEINSLPATAALAAATRQSAAVGELMSLLTPAADVVPSGETVQAEVVALKQAATDFLLTLRLNLPSGQQTNVQVSSFQPLSQGTLLLVSQTSSDALTVAVAQNRASNLTALDTQKVPVGTLLQAKVITSQLLPAEPTASNTPTASIYRSLVTVLNSALVGETLTIDSPQPLRVGSLLSAQVQGSQELNFVPLSGRLDQLAVAGQLNAQQNRQGSLDGLLNLLQDLDSRGSLSADLQSAASRVLSQLPDIRQLSDSRGVALALQDSGLFMEPRLLQGLPPTDLKSALLQLVSQLTSTLPDTGGQPFNPANAAILLAQSLPGYVRSALGMLGQVSAKPQVGGFPLPARMLPAMEGENDLQHLLRLATAALSRVQSHQLASLDESGSDADNKLQTTWQLEIPMRDMANIVPLQVKIQREDPPPQKQESEERRESAQNPQERIWRVELAFDLSPLGPLQVQAQLQQGSLSSQLWAEVPGTAQMIAAQLGYLREQLVSAGLQVADLDCHQGVAPRGKRTHLEHRWVDENA
ncbi:MAG: flagellar hook-length control protein FliK [Janthinobacterium lividum]